MSTYYKAVRPDLSSFHDPSYVYRIGGTHRPRQPRSERMELCAELLLHASPTPPQATRSNAHWPWRILEVTGRPVVEDDTKAGFRQLRVLREVPVEASFGPNGAAVLAVIRRAEHMTEDETKQLTAAWYAAWAAAGAAARDAAWYAAGDAARAAARIAAKAAAVADLVGQHGLTQKHIDTLIAPWKKVMG